MRYLLANISARHSCVFRVNVKIHKNPVETRPITSMRLHIVEPGSQFVNQALLPLLDRYSTIMTSSAQVVRAIEKLVVEPGVQLVAFDITQLFPSMLCHGTHPAAVMSLLGPVIDGYFSSQGKFATGDLVIRLLQLLLSSLIINYGDRSYKVTRGLAPGIPCANTIANLYFALGYDDHVLHTQSTLFYGRYVDDGLFVTRAATSKASLSITLSQWHESLVVKPKDVQIGSAVNFLDLQLQVRGSHIVTSTYRKQHAMYDYVPPVSAHAPTIFPAIVSGEINRLLVTNTHEDTYLEQVKLFKKRLSLRGYDLNQFDRIFSWFPHHRRKHVLCSSRKKANTTRHFRLITAYSKGIERIAWTKLKRCSGLISKHLGDSDVSIAYRSTPNIFRKIYRLSWRAG
eukprot:TRINITY_DN39790_c0_g1_i1.p1 TRINITY_DN39790_c0_g1~~TRINITY_DN39790_c0_g1_i1.p1  ORF type:complete len:399 (+),score=4.27 TRINITY_DN39790_c0_g1_i1:462-1658(+)